MSYQAKQLPTSLSPINSFGDKTGKPVGMREGSPTPLTPLNPFSGKPLTAQSQQSQQSQLQQTQALVDQTVVIMRDNVEKILERDVKMTNLEDQTENLLSESDRFETSAKKLKRKMWWKNTKFMLILAAIVAILIMILALIIWGTTKH